MIPFDRCDVLSFDCYGTLVDWESGILAALRPWLAAKRSARAEAITDDELLQLHARLESEAESGEWLPYRDVLAQVVRGIGTELGFRVQECEESLLADSLGAWPPFEDTVTALRELGREFGLAIVSNVDRDLFERTRERLCVPFDWVITAEDAKSYKPSPANFERAREEIGVPPERWLHAAQSLFHDVVPASALGIRTIWVDRRRGLPGAGATPPASAEADLEVASLEELASLVRDFVR